MNFDELDSLFPTVEYYIHRIATPSWEIIRNTIDFHDLVYIYKGKATYLINDIPFQIKSGDVLYIPYGNLREAYTYEEDPMHAYVFNFNCLINGVNCLRLPLPTLQRVGRFNELKDLCKEFNRTWIEKNQGYRLKARALFMQILHKLLTVANWNNADLIMDSRVSTIKEYVINHFYEDLSIENLAEMVGLNPVYLGALFKKNTGYSIKEYIANIRINSAESLLSMGGYTVGEAAERCGFEDIYYFSKVFKKHKGYPPSHALR